MLYPSSSSQKAEMIVLTQAPEFPQGEKVNIYVDSNMIFDNSCIWGNLERGLLTSHNNKIKNLQEILQLLEAIFLVK